MNPPLTPAQTTGIKAYADAHSDEVVAIYLYGSMVEGVANALSDVDLVILLREPLKRDAFDIQIDATVALQRLFDQETDVQVLTRATGLPFLEEVFKYAQSIAVNDAHYAAIYRSVMTMQIIDFQPMYTILNQAMLARLANGTFGTPYAG